ncbi:auxin-responsive protein SAUR32-like [Neltuma alba]|uniref:auxin-responsive protein SAUR32-like n=1 Tax=Neltuma alba TaxID=207710 RepID=UPI0010A50375|nr:auxin-responsive protein SAUR32-like [Prosopis alba]
MGADMKIVNFHVHMPHLLHFHHHDKKHARHTPKGCLAVLVGQGAQQQRFVIPVMYFNHPLFIHLLQEAEQEYGFHQKGLLTIPCPVDDFRTVQDLIHQEEQHHHHAWCFKT